MEPLILTVASTGSKWTRMDSPWVPLVPKEIIEDVLESIRAGASMAHLHARTDKGDPSQEPEMFAAIIEPLRCRCNDIVIQISTGFMEGQVEKKLEPLLRLKPDLASFNLKGSHDETLLMASLMKKYNVKPVVEIFSVEMIEKTKQLLHDGILKIPVFMEFVFNSEEDGRSFKEIAGELLLWEKNLPDGVIWSQTRGASNQKGLQALASGLGGNLRTGMEDNLFTKPGIKAKRSTELIKNAAAIAEIMGRRIATPMECRKLLGLE